MVIFALKRVRPFTRIFEKEGKSRLMNVVNGRELAALNVGLPTIHQCAVVAMSLSPHLLSGNLETPEPDEGEHYLHTVDEVHT